MLIIVNPAAGRRRRAARGLDRVVAALQRRGCTVVVRRAAAAGDAERIAREAAATFDIVVAAGGDGTLNAVANGLAGSDRVMAVLPFGTANVLAHEIGLPRRPERLAALIAVGPAMPIWPGRVAGRVFLMMASSGWDAEIVAAVDPRLKRRLGRLAFVWAFLAGWWRYRAMPLSVRIDGVEHRAAMVIAAKGRHYAGPFVVAPDAALGDPTLHFVLLRRSGRAAVLRYLAALALGRIARLPDVTVVRGREAWLDAAAPLPLQADGEIVASLPVRIGIAERPLLLVQPQRRPRPQC